MSKSRIKTIIIVFFDIRGIIHCKFVPQGQAVNLAFYLEVLRRLKRRIARVRTDIKDTVNLHHDNATSHTAFIITNFLARSNTSVIPHPPYSPDLAPCDFFLFPRLKREMKGKHWETVENIQHHVTTFLRSIPVEEFQVLIRSGPEFHRPWQKVGMDLFYLNGRWYLIVCDYYSRHGTPETVRSDNGPQFQKVLGSEFSKFSKEWSFKHITSSPKFPQSNGFIEAIIKKIKQSFKKEEDCYLTLQAYRTMPLESGYSPAELLMGRRLRTSVPAIESSLMPRYLDSEALQEREKRRVINQKRLYDKRHDVHSLPPLQQGDSVWIRDQRVEGTVLHKSEEPRSYWVQTPQGKVRRNRLHLTPLPKMGSTMDASEDGQRQEQRNEETPTSTSTWLSRRCKDDQEQETEEDCPTPTASSTRDGRMQRDNQDQDPEKSLPSMPAVHTRYGRAVKIPRSCVSAQDNVKKYMKRANDIELRGKGPRINKEAAARFIKNSLNRAPEEIDPRKVIGALKHLLYRDGHQIEEPPKKRSDGRKQKEMQEENLPKEEYYQYVKFFEVTINRHGTPETVRSDNGPQFQKVLGSEFSKFSKEWSFKHITSSPKFPQSNGFIEAIIKKIKQSFKKEEDCYLTLQAYRTMPLESGYSPAELLMGRRLRTSVPAIESSLMPRYLDSEALQEREKRRVINQKRLYDKRHDVHSLPPLQQGDSVWIRDQRVEGTVLHKSEEPRSYWVQTPQGKVRRNRLHLTPLPKMGSTMDASEDGQRQEQRNEETPTSTSTWLSRRCKDDQEQETEEDCPTPTASSTRDGRMQRDNQDQDPEKSLPSMPAVHTRYGRAVKIPRSNCWNHTDIRFTSTAAVEPLNYGNLLDRIREIFAITPENLMTEREFQLVDDSQEAEMKLTDDNLLVSTVTAKEELGEDDDATVTQRLPSLREARTAAETVLLFLEHSKRATSDDVNLSADLLRRVYAISEGEKTHVLITDFFKKMKVIDAVKQLLYRDGQIEETPRKDQMEENKKKCRRKIFPKRNIINMLNFLKSQSIEEISQILPSVEPTEEEEEEEDIVIEDVPPNIIDTIDLTTLADDSDDDDDQKMESYRPPPPPSQPPQWIPSRPLQPLPHLMSSQPPHWLNLNEPLPSQPLPPMWINLNQPPPPLPLQWRAVSQPQLVARPLQLRLATGQPSHLLVSKQPLLPTPSHLLLVARQPTPAPLSLQLLASQPPPPPPAPELTTSPSPPPPPAPELTTSPSPPLTKTESHSPTQSFAQPPRKKRQCKDGDIQHPRSLSRIFFELFANCVANLPFRSQAAPLAVKLGDSSFPQEECDEDADKLYDLEPLMPQIYPFLKELMSSKIFQMLSHQSWTCVLCRKYQDT
ncbi:K02A2.6-like [Cordylochernes scorpioides]|uniref:K02A2.6-like n=1 Tax=Cordylochernes scorpioides TaxID=51811 RepID=A0ABY6KQU1_9ARAC|nr:K02A2.6-like [Cordylochernes scorpioides]